MKAEAPPPFDPKAPLDNVAPSFDPKRSLDDVAPPFDPKMPLDGGGQKTSTLDASTEGFGNGLSLEHLAQLQAKAQPITDRLADAIQKNGGVLSTAGKIFRGVPLDEGSGPVAPWSQLTENGKDYTDARDANLERQALQDKEHPYAVLGSKVAGTALGGYLGANAVGAAGRLLIAPKAMQAAEGAEDAAKAWAELSNSGKTWGQLVKNGAIGLTKAGAAGLAAGALQNPGDTKGIVDPIQADARGENAKTGAAYGLATELGLGALRNGASMIEGSPALLKGLAESRAAKLAQSPPTINLKELAGEAALGYLSGEGEPEEKVTRAVKFAAGGLGAHYLNKFSVPILNSASRAAGGLVPLGAGAGAVIRSLQGGPAAYGAAALGTSGPNYEIPPEFISEPVPVQATAVQRRMKQLK